MSTEPKQRYLDVGCGNGAAPIHVARKYGLDVTGGDVDPEQIRLAEKRRGDLRNPRFFTIDGTDLPFQEREFHIVATNKVMHHIPNWEDALAEMIRVLRPDGYLIYSDLAFPGWVAAVGKSLLKNYSGFPTRRALETLIEKYQLVKVYLSASPVHYEGVFQKTRSTIR